MKNFSINSTDFSPEELNRIDERIRAAMMGWSVHTYTPGRGWMNLENLWGGEIYPYRYFEVIKEPGDPNPGEQGNEIQCYLSCGWRGMDDEAQIWLTLLGHAVLDDTAPVMAVLYYTADNPVEIFRDGKLVTDFTQYGYRDWFRDVGWFPRRKDRVIVRID